MERFHASLDLAEVVARQIARSVGQHVDQQDLVSLGREGLLVAARRFDPERGVPFRLYANYRVRGAILDGVRKMAALPRRAHERLRALEAAASFNEGALEDLQASAPPGAKQQQGERVLGDHLAAMATAMAVGLLAQTVPDAEGRTSIDPAGTPEDALGRAELLHAVRSAIEELPKDEGDLLRRHYFEGRPFEELARELGLSKSWVSRLHTRAVKRLTRRLRGVQD